MTHLLDQWATEDFCYLTTNGRRTGKPHTIENWYGLREGKLYMLSGGGDRADRVRNLKVDPTIELRIGDRTFGGGVRVATDPAEDALARRLLAAGYPGRREGQRLSGWARAALPVVVEVDPESGR